MVAVAVFFLLALACFSMGLSDSVAVRVHQIVFQAPALETAGAQAELAGEAGEAAAPLWQTNEGLLAGAGLVFLALGVLLVVAMPARSRKYDVLTYTQEGSEVRIARRAVEDFISRLGKEIEGVSDMSCWVAMRNEKIQVNVHIAVDVGVIAIPEASHEVKALIEREMRETLGFPNMGETNVQVSRLNQTGSTVQRARRPELGAEVEPEPALPPADEVYQYETTPADEEERS